MLDLHRVSIELVTDGELDLTGLKTAIEDALNQDGVSVWFDGCFQFSLKGQGYREAVEALSIDIPNEDWLEYADMKHDQRGTRS